MLDNIMSFHGRPEALARYMKVPFPGVLGGPRVTTEIVTKHFLVQEKSLSYRIRPHFHPYVAQLVRRLLTGRLRGLQGADTEYVVKNDGTFELLDGKPKPVLHAEIFSNAAYAPTAMVSTPYPVKDLDFTSGGPYAIYNWELFFHVPYLIGLHLSRNGRYAEARRWLHYLFDPTDGSDAATPQRFWQVRPFQTTDVKSIEAILVNLATGADPVLQSETIDSINAWKDAPFRPHVVARLRQSPYMLRTVMTYLDNLIAWGDSLFREDTRESINEATQLYVMAANLLGTRPQAVPKRGTVRAQTYASLRSDLDRFGNALRELETDIPFDIVAPPSPSSDSDQQATLRSLGYALYFAVPRNDVLLRYWDTVADRLFKIRNSLNLQGIFRQLPLFEPPIDPALLARGVAAGLDVAAITAGVNQPLPLVRFQPLVQKALEICAEVRGMGAMVLSTLEKEDGEALAILRAKHERVVLGLAEVVRYGQWQEAIKAREGLEASLLTAAQRYTYYERLLGRDGGAITIPELDDVDVAALDKLKLQATEPEVARREVPIDIDPGAAPLAEGAKLSRNETKEMKYLGLAQTAQSVAAWMDVMAGIMNVIPSFSVNVSPFGCGGSVSFGGSNIAAIYTAIGASFRGSGGALTYDANRASKIGTYARREQDWTFQSNLAALEIGQLFKQLRGAQIREAVAEREWKNHQQQLRHAEEIERFLADEKTGKRTNRAFYGWMKREVKALHGDCYQLAFDVARKAERALRHELGDPSLTYLKAGYQSGKEGLLAGEKLYLDVKRMEIAFLDLRQREYELVKHVSLGQLDAVALLQLRATGRCSVTIPEEVYDLDGPGHYFRRIRGVSVTIPCVAGPYSSVNCTLTLRKSTVRKTPVLGAREYRRENAEDDRFSDHFGSLLSIVTSSGQNDDGLFDGSRDERAVPFEGAGAISEWMLELPSDVRQFDYETIQDVILRVQYTAREGGAQLRAAANQNLQSRITEAQALGSMRLVSVRHEFPAAWAKFRATAPPAGERSVLTMELTEDLYPFWSRGRLGSVERVEVFARSANAQLSAYVAAQGNVARDTFVSAPAMNGKLLAGRLENVGLPNPTGSFTLYLDDRTVSDLWLGIAWKS